MGLGWVHGGLEVTFSAYRWVSSGFRVLRVGWGGFSAGLVRGGWGLKVALGWLDGSWVGARLVSLRFKVGLRWV